MNQLNKLTVIIIFLLLLYLPTQSFSQGATFVVTENVEEKTFHDQITLVGRTEALIESQIVSEISGRVSKINAVEGSFLKKNSPLITIDGEHLNLSLQAKQAEATQAKVQSELARGQKIRAVELRDQKLISATAMDSANAWEAIQTARYNQLEAERKKLELDYNNAVIKAPFTGYTGRKLVNVGEWVTPGQAVYEMVDLSKIKIIADLPERYFGHLIIGSKVYITVSNGSENKVVGYVTGISPNASTTTHTYPVIIEIDNKDGKFGGGMLVRATLSLNEEFSSLSVSKDAIIRQGNQTIVYTINEGKAISIPVTIISTSGKSLAVQSPMLKAGMPVVIRGNERIYPGATVTTGEEKESDTTEKQNQDS